MSSPPPENNISQVVKPSIGTDAVPLVPSPSGEASVEDSEQREGPVTIKAEGGSLEEKAELVIENVGKLSDNSVNGLVAEKEEGSEDEVDGLVYGEAEGRQTLSEHHEDGAQDGVEEEMDETGQVGNEETLQERDRHSRSSSRAAEVPSNRPAETSSVHSQAASIPSSFIRAPTPSSRTSTPPLSSAAAGKPKKFSSVNVNQKFLKQTASPAPVAGGSAKLGSLSGRPAASPLPIASPSSRLLATKLTSVPGSKPSTSPNPSNSVGGSSSSSPWAKPAAPLVEPLNLSRSGSPADAPSTTTLAQPAPTKSRGLVSTSTATVIGSGQILSAAPKKVWGAVGGDGRGQGTGLTRDFPTAKEVADGQKARVMHAQLAAQATAAHNQEILQKLNAFTQLDPNSHRWDDEDEDDDVIDFGDGTVYRTHDSAPSHPPASSAAPSATSAPVTASAEPVPKSERFQEDFDRSWPRRSASPPRAPAVVPSKRQDEDRRVLFNANSNRLEPSSSRSNPLHPVQPTRLMSRGEPPRDRRLSNNGIGSAGFERPLPPHLQGGPGDGGRMLPPHMNGSSSDRPPLGSMVGRRPSWGNHDRQLPPHLTERNRELPPQSAAFQNARSPPRQINPTLPARRSFSQQAPPNFPHPPPQSISSTHQTATQGLPPAVVSAALVVDAQSAEMHSAAEKARLRRLAEEAEREAVAERARQKARELEERLKPKSAALPAPAPVESSPTKPIPQITIASRPKPSPAPEPQLAINNHSTGSGLPNRPGSDVKAAGTQSSISKQGESSWRRTNDPPRTENVPPPPQSIPTGAGRSNRPTAESFFETQPTSSADTRRPERDSWRGNKPVTRDTPPHVGLPPVAPGDDEPRVTKAPLSEVAQTLSQPQPQKEGKFDDMLARLQAAMTASRNAPPSAAAPVPEVQLTIKKPVKETPPVSVKPAPPPGLPQSAPPPQLKSAAPVVPPQPISLVPTYFEITQIEVPRSPPPAWRTYTIKVPKPIPSSLSRIRPASGAKYSVPTLVPKGWIMSLNPPLEGLKPATLSRAELLIPQPVKPRFQKSGEVLPIVSISPRKLEKFQKKGKKKINSSVSAGPEKPMVQIPEVFGQAPVESAETVSPVPLGTVAAPLASRPLTLRNGGEEGWRKKAEPTTEIQQISVVTVSVPATNSAPSTSTERKSQSPVKTEKEKHRFVPDSGVGINTNIPASRGRTMMDAKPGVRFMVSSELEGDRLLDEINKMSLEAVGEGEGSGSEGKSEGAAGELLNVTSGNETPKTPPSLIGPSSRTHPSSPNGTSDPWAKPTLSYPVSQSPRSSSQHDHLKNVWSQPSSQPKETSSGTTAADFQPKTSTQSAENTPMYPSINGPSPSPTPATIPQLPGSSSAAGATKMSYTSSQSFSSPGAVAPSLTSSNSYGLRQSPGHGGYGLYGVPSPVGQQMTSPDGGVSQQQFMMSSNYGTGGRSTTTTNGGMTSPAVNGYSQAGLWTSPGFGSSGVTPMHQSGGYGYAKSQPSGTEYKGIQYGKPEPVYSSPSTGYNHLQSASVGGYPGHGQSQSYGHPSSGYGHASMTSTSSGQRGYVGVGVGQSNVQASQNGMYGYGANVYGAPGSVGRGVAGRPGYGQQHINGSSGDYSGGGGYGKMDASGYYGATLNPVNGTNGQGAQAGMGMMYSSSGVGGYGGHGAIGSQGIGRGTGAGTVTSGLVGVNGVSHQGSGGAVGGQVGRKAW